MKKIMIVLAMIVAVYSMASNVNEPTQTQVPASKVKIRPASPLNGRIFWNDSTKVFEGWNGTSWLPLSNDTTLAKSRVHSVLGSTNISIDSTNTGYPVVSITGTLSVAETPLNMVVGGGVAARAGMTSWNCPSGYNTIDSSVADSAVGLVAPRTCSARHLYVTCSPAPGASDTVYVTLARSGGVSIVTTFIHGTATQSAKDITNAVSFSAGDMIQVKAVSTSGSSATKVSWGFDLQAN